MKKLYLLILLPLLLSVMAKGEGYRTLDLLGTWELTDSEGTNALMRSIENVYLRGEGPVRYMYLGEFSHETHPSWVYQDDHSDYEYYFLGALTAYNPEGQSNYYEYWGVSAFWISDGDNLHILGADGYNDCNESFFFVIESMSGSELKLRTFDNKMRLTFKRVSDSEYTKSTEVSPLAEGPESIYTLDGMKVEEPGKGLYIVKRDKETNKIIK